MKFLHSLGDAILDRSPDELIGAILLALMVGIAGSIVSRFAIWRKPGEGVPMLAGGLLFMVSLASMAVGAGYLVSVDPALSPTAREKIQLGIATGRSLGSRPGLHRPARPGFPPPNWRGPVLDSDERVLPTAISDLLDLDHDGTISPEEAARFVREVDTDGNGSADVASIRKALHERYSDHTARARTDRTKYRLDER